MGSCLERKESHPMATGSAGTRVSAESLVLKRAKAISKRASRSCESSYSKIDNKQV